jgi:hypothetical protein
MRTGRRSVALGIALVALGAVATADPLDDSIEALARAAREHQAALARLLEIRDAELDGAEADLARRRDLAARDLIAHREVADAEARVASARTRLDDTRQEIADADTLVAEARAAVALARTPPRPGEERRTDDHIVFGGGSPWSLGRAVAIERFFAARFGRTLPVSARGQTELHDRLGFDHRHALDVAVHPDTVEGRALLDYLKRERIPFIAFRHAERGAATGAHVHIGEPSARKPSRRAGTR